jgi:queuine/archaeosine tRNA-ribosyltransferase
MQVLFWSHEQDWFMVNSKWKLVHFKRLFQASLEAEARAKEESLRIKKKLEADINEMEIALDHANKAHAEAKKAIKRTHNGVSWVRKCRSEVLLEFLTSNGTATHKPRRLLRHQRTQAHNSTPNSRQKILM